MVDVKSKSVNRVVVEIILIRIRPIGYFFYITLVGMYLVIGSIMIVKHILKRKYNAMLETERLNMRREGHFIKPAFFKTTDEGEPIWHDRQSDLKKHT